MKTTKILMIVSLILTSISAFSQQDANSFFDENGNIASNLPTSGPKEDLKPIEFLNPRADDIYWQMVVYRMIDLREKINFPLYFPEEATDGRQSLFTLLFNLLREGKIYGYEYVDGKEVFSEDTKISFDEELLQKMGISLYSTEVDPVTNETLFKVDESDIPNREVMKFYLKEVWYFDKHSSIFNVKTLAICPVLYRDDSAEGMGISKIPLFWIPFDLLRPHLSQTEVLLSDKNNGMRLSFDDLFIKRRYGSYVFKFTNVYNRNLLQYCTTAEEAKREQNALKTQLINFEEDLWEY
ncbi:MAG: gliding motility protein GldN [Tannerella sp.]|jgi:gliding motility associated protien GldN|nr:gliding motility protein GldN [Tannerella sp.]